MGIEGFADCSAVVVDGHVEAAIDDGCAVARGDGPLTGLDGLIEPGRALLELLRAHAGALLGQLCDP